MSDQELPSTSTSKDISNNLQKNFVNRSVQHGKEENADEENIVVLLKSYSPVREIDNPVEIEEFEYHDYLLKKAFDSDCDDDLKVSTKTFIILILITFSLMYLFLNHG